MEKKKQPKSIGAGVLLFIIFIFGDLAGLVCNFVGYVYPAYMSFKAIESKEKEDDTQWLTYWVVYSFFSVLETFISFLLNWIPFYFAFKLAFLIYLFHPKYTGAKTIYDNFLKKLLENAVDAKPVSEVEKVNNAVSSDKSKDE